MREIKFRGIPLFGESFVFGSLIIEPNERGEDPYIIRIYENGRVCYFEVKKDSIGQYAGLKDKNEVEIYEGDILQIDLDWGYGPAKIVSKVYFENGCFRAKALNSHEDTLLIELPPCEVIGNIYGNPELLEGAI